MGSVERRLRQLERRRRAEAVAEVESLFKQLTDEEIALTITGDDAARDGRELTAEEIAVRCKADETGVEELIAAAIGLEEGMDEEEVSRRISALARELRLWQGREQRIGRHLTAIRRKKVCT